MSSFPSDIPGLKKSLTVLEHALNSLNLSIEHVKTTIGSLDNVSTDLRYNAVQALSSKVDVDFLNQIIEEVSNKITSQEQELRKSSLVDYSKKDRAWFINNLNHWTNEEIFDQEGLQYLKIRLSNFNDFRHNGLEIGCGQGYWYQWLAALSPLYQADINWNFFPMIAGQFQPLFFAKDRMRFVKTTGTDLPGVDNDAIDFVFSWNTFNFLPIEVINQYLSSIYKAMKPGAYAIIGYTNAYREDSYQQVLDGRWAYNNSDVITQSIIDAKFEPRALFETGQRGSWIEFVKPGTKIHTVDYPKPGDGYCKKVFYVL
jgi:SAM-dependent methyltransferase